MKHEILTLVGKNCITPIDGQKVYDLVHPELQADQPVELDFNGVEIFASPFFNFAIGQLLRDISPDNLNRLLKFSDLKPVGRQTLKLVIENSKRYYSDPKFRDRLDQVISEQANNL
ncbi:STAS-like domain-containing protein [Dolichospermum sp. ST_con]|nr:STAS-like domain-containing protein [Dolichospermum sp. DET66]MBS3035758.1 STAS-like domain-containing protein [Dolichospermum sp. DET67]MBS3040960.1 STAS-like domain-containing protein [Dolichospermum sp. DET50]MDD1415461.1 STAS-like domain-containing protein [Dolichospermum sp. ST_con]MDD1419268.1 STAS-like domain-containing protein [Dolichospermum sp. ST_sed1]MDD1425143.1 STAS-like domain-containing protein [Dolichospermum sp. ST_sed9]MDD1431103.1 STAS-like domain-containing protein [Do